MAVPDEIRVERPRVREHGDWATNVALQLAKPAGVPPRQVAEVIAARLGDVPGIKSVEVAGPGFLNIVLDAAAAGELARSIVTEGAAYGRLGRPRRAADQPRVRLGQPDRPDAPRRRALGRGRRLARPESLPRRALRSRGSTTSTTTGSRSTGSRAPCWRRRRVSRHPRTATAGEYIGEIAAAGRWPSSPAALDLPDDEAQEIFRRDGVELMFTEIKASLHDFGVDFDVYFHENDLHESGAVDGRSSGCASRATSSRPTARSGCAPPSSATTRTASSSRATASRPTSPVTWPTTSTSASAASTGASIMLGADHHGYIGRLMAMCAAFGDTPGVNLEILIGQMVNLVKDGQPVRMSKRAGNIVTHGGPGRRGRGRRCPLRAGALVGRLADRHRPRPAGPSAPTTTRSTTCSTPMRGPPA